MIPNIEKDIADTIRQVKIFTERQLPIRVGRIAQQHFQDNFRKGGFVNNGLQKWQPAKRLSSGSKSAAANYGTLLSSRKMLFSSINYVVRQAAVQIYNDLDYAAIHNEGGNITVRVTPKMRKFAWAKYCKSAANRTKSGNTAKRETGSESSDALMWKRLALTHKDSLNIHIPQRQFVGDSAELDANIITAIERGITEILNQKK